MENSKVKALFFAQYYGQCVVQVSNGIGNNLQPVTGRMLYDLKPFDNPYLLLRAVDQLTDEEKYYLSELTQDLSLNNERLKLKVLHSDFEMGAYQYLIRIGILIPFTYIDENGKPQTLQPDEIIANGWAKLHPSNHLDK